MKDDNIFLIEKDNADARLLFDSDPNDFTVADRFNYVLSKLMPYLRRQLSETFVKQKLASVLDIKVKIMGDLLTDWVNSPINPKNKCITEFLNRTFSESNQKVVLDENTFVGPFSTFELLHKIAMIITKFKVSVNQLKWLFKEGYGASVGWLDLNSLPLNEASEASFDAWERMFDLFQLRNGLADGEKVLTDLFDIARNENTTRNMLLEKLSEDTGWSLEDLNSLIVIKGFNLSFPGLPNDPNVVIPDPYKNERALKQLKDCFTIMKKLGISANQCIALANPEPTFVTINKTINIDQAVSMSRSIKQAVKSKYDIDQWLSIAKPLRDGLREKQRSLLVAYLLANPDPDPNKKQNWVDVNDLYGHFLIDVEMSPCQMTSRIKQANGSIQLFVQRCLMNFREY